MPMTAKVRRIVGNHHKMERARWDGQITPRADIGLPGGIGLYRTDRQPLIAHTSKATMIAMVPITIATSNEDLRAGRKGLKPTIFP